MNGGTATAAGAEADEVAGGGVGVVDDAGGANAGGVDGGAANGADGADDVGGVGGVAANGSAVGDTSGLAARPAALVPVARAPVSHALMASVTTSPPTARTAHRRGIRQA